MNGGRHLAIGRSYAIVASVKNNNEAGFEPSEEAKAAGAA
jgi:hypothetical protein